ncbi:hypothetical protein COOONC_02304, partial [Cooperia oncophora]
MPDILWTSVSEPVAIVSTSKAFLDVCSSHGLSQHVSTYTHGSRILDLVLSSDDNLMNNQTISWVGSLNSATKVDDKYELFIFILRHTIESFVFLARVSPQRKHLPRHLRSLISENQLLGGGPPLLDCMRTGNPVVPLLPPSTSNYARTIYLSKRGLCERPGLGVLKAVDGSIVRKGCEKSELIADTFAKAFNPPSALNIPSRSASFPIMTDSTRFSEDETYQLLIKWPSSTSDTPDHVP